VTNIQTSLLTRKHVQFSTLRKVSFLDGYCSTAQGLLDWFEVDLGFTELSFIQIDLCVLCDFVLYMEKGILVMRDIGFLVMREMSVRTAWGGYDS